MICDDYLFNGDMLIMDDYLLMGYIYVLSCCKGSGYVDVELMWFGLCCNI